MDPMSPATSGPELKVRGARSSSVIVHRVAAGRAQAFLEWQDGITAAVKSFAGYQATEVYPPIDGQNSDWVVLIHFDTPELLQRWLDSPERAAWIVRLQSDMGDFRLKTLPTGFGAWFAGLVNGSKGSAPPSWKIALSVLLALYPTVVLIAIFLGHYLNQLGLALSMLLSNIMSVSVLQWAVMPRLRRLLGPWLNANEKKQRAYSLGGLAVILLSLGGMAILFHLVKN